MWGRARPACPPNVRVATGWAGSTRVKGLISVLFFASLVARADLPAGWSLNDLNSPSQPGTASYTGDSWTLTAGGAGICPADQFSLVSRTCDGDAEVVVRVASLSSSEPTAQAGVMFRNDFSAEGTMVALLAAANNSIAFQWRFGQGWSCGSYTVAGAPVPVWLKLTRGGNLFSAFYSVDGQNWIPFATPQSVALPESTRVGLAVSSANPSTNCTATFTDFSVPPPAFGVYAELWRGLSSSAGNSLAALTNASLNPNWPNNPTTNSFYPGFETESNTGETYYGRRLRAFIVPPTNGTYTFWIASDDTSQLLLSDDESAERARPIAWVNAATGPREWTKEPNQVSALVGLVAARRYHLEVRMQQSTGSDHLSVRWRLPNGTYEEPLATGTAAGTRLVPNRGSSETPKVHQQPSPLAVAYPEPAVFTVLSTSQGPLNYQWQASGTNIAGETAQTSVLILTNTLPFRGQPLTCILSNTAGAVTSAPAPLTVLLDEIPPAALLAQYRSSTNVEIFFSEPLDPASATNTANYVFTNGLSVSKVYLSADGTSVLLSTAPLTFGANYGIRLNNIKDRSPLPNTIAANTVVRLFAAPYTPQDVGNPTPVGTIQSVPGGYDVGGGGTDIGVASADQFQFAYQLRTGDFDVNVRVSGLSQTDMLAKGGLMAREDLSAGSRYAATFATPSISGCFFSYRVSAGGKATASLSVQANYPDTWLRLKRVGDLFTGYASYDGRTWQVLSSASIAMSNSVCVGMAVTSRDSSHLAIAQFRDLSDVTDAKAGVLTLPNEPPGPSSRKTGLVISEIMYHPIKRDDGRDLEFIEVFNSQPWYEDISGYALTGEVSFKFPPNTILPGGAYIVVGAVPADLQAVYGIENLTGPYTNHLSNSAGMVRLRDRWGAVLLEVNYDSVSPWPVAADGGGHSLVLARPSYGENDPRAWAASDHRGGSPGMNDGTGNEPTRGVVINEFLAHTDPPLFDYIELFNKNNSPVDLSGCYLTDNPETNKFRIPMGTTLPARGHMVFDENQLGFRLDAAGETLYLINATNSRVVDAVRFEGQANGVSTGRSPDGAPELRVLASRTPGAPNSGPLVHDVVINEIMYDPISRDADDQFVELYNKGSQPVDLSGWRFTDGIDYRFPKGTVIPPDGYFVVAKDRWRMLTNYPGLNAAVVFGNFSGNLKGSGERIALSYPDTITSTNSHGVVTTNLIDILADEVTYGVGGRWGRWADRGGSSLELSDPHADNSLAPNWADSDETAKAPWTTIECTGRLDLGNSTYPADQLQVFLQGAGECLLDNVEVFVQGSTNRITNGTFSNGVTAWTFQGTHRASGLENAGGYDGGRCLHVRASARGDTGANRIRGALSPALTSGATVTIRAQARWLKGSREILLRLRGNWLEAAGQMTLPRNLGTPGARNSRYVGNAGPAITAVSHAPVLPLVGEPVVVTARVSDPDGLASVKLVYRNDTSGAATQTLDMIDDGTGGDQAAGDGIFSARIPGQASKSVIAFYLEAADSQGAKTRFPDDAPTRECLVSVGEPIPVGSLGTYRIWLTRSTINYWAGREKNSNDPVDATFVYGNSRVVYNIQTLYSGSPFHTSSYTSPVGAICDYVLNFPDDEPFLGAKDFVLASTGNLGNDETAQREQAAFWILREMGAPSLYRRFINLYANGGRRGAIMEDAQQPNSDTLEEYFPGDSQGNLHKIEDWFEFDNAGSAFDYITATLQNFTTFDGTKKVARYRWNWRPRAVQDTANDFTNLFLLVDAVGLGRPEPYTQQVGAMADVEEWMKTLALERLAGNWDSWGYNRGKNMYAYRPEHGRWHLLAWDVDFSMGKGDGATTGLTGGHDSAVNTMIAHPPFARAYWRAFYDAANGPMQDTQIGRLLDAKYAGLTANGITVTAPTAVKSYISQRRTYLQQQLARYLPAFSVGSTVVNNSTALLSGVAPVSVKTVLFNGIEYPVTWATATNWTAAVPLKAGSNQILVTGYGSDSTLIPGASRTVTANLPTALPSPAGQVVFSEIMYHPALPGAEFVELYNASSAAAFDLSGWSINGLDYTFPMGSLLRTNSYLVLAADREAFAVAYGAAIPVFDTFSGSLQNDGETLTLLQPFSGTNQVVAKLRYEDHAPWPLAADGWGGSLQLIDPRQDNWRAGNWGAATTNMTVTPRWIYVTVSATAPSSRLYFYLQSAGEIYIDDVKLVAGNTPEAGPNLLVNGGFESLLASPWIATANFANSSVSTAVKYSGNSSLRLVATAAGSGSGNAFYQDITPALTTGQPYTLSFWYLQTTNGGPLVARMSGSGFTTGAINPAPAGGGRIALFTPGASNSIARTVPAFPSLWINEIQPENLSGITNRLGQRAPWIEIFNPSTNTLSLGGLYLGTNYENQGLWPFPSNAVVRPREFRLIFADAQPNLTTSNEWHANFALPKGAGSLALTRILPGADPEVLDYLDYTNVHPNRSFGSLPDAQSFERREFVFVTPGATNNGASNPIDIYINEWMAENTSTLADPAGGGYEDWFELYNPGATAVDIGGYFLTDTLTNKFQFRIPDNGTYLVPPGGFLLVWADGEPGQNSTNSRDLHVNFKLDKNGEAIGLYGADGAPVDFVTFGRQAPDLSEGRYPDGAATILFLSVPTPLTNNLVPNTPPRLTTIPDRTCTVGQGFFFAVTASDTDIPPQQLLYTLGPGAPPEALLHPQTGVFTWTPSAPGTNRFTVWVTDSGVPNLSASQSFTLTVLPVPQFDNIILTGNQLRLSFDTVSGQRYQLEVSTTLHAGDWSPAGTVVIGTGGIITVTDQISSAAGQLFYRITVVP